MKKVEITFGSEYSYYGKIFENNLREALNRGGYELAKMDNSSTKSGAIFIDGNTASSDHDVHKYINLAENWTDEEAC